MKPFFIEIQNFWAWADKLGRQIGVLSVEPLAPILVQSVPCPCFSLFNHYLYKKLSLYTYPHPNYYLGLGYEFGPQRISPGFSLRVV
jgi:hypothetical protein